MHHNLIMRYILNSSLASSNQPRGLRRPLLSFSTWALVLTAMCLAAPAARAQKTQPHFAEHHRDAAQYRSMLMRDENGQIPDNALMNALKQKQQMQLDLRPWPGS